MNGMRVLIIKLTSMGDLMHAFPALTDAMERIPNIQFDWVVDESFAEVPKWHPAVHRVITTAHRRWKKNVLDAWSAGEFREFRSQLNEDDYDVVVDLQSNLKSAFVSWLRRGAVHGYDKKTCREKPAHWAYKKHHHIPLRQHAIERQRALFAEIFQYDRPQSVPSYGVNLHKTLAAEPLYHLSLPEKYVVFVHNASWPTKLWPIVSWQALINKVAEQGYAVLLPCGSDAEYQRAKTIADSSPAAIALDKMSLNMLAMILLGAKAAVCSDTGLAHLAAVAATPAITLYAVTDTLLIGTVGQSQQHVVAKKGDLPARMEDISVDQVWQKLSPLLLTQ
jgi:heptosyltransferase I